MIPVRKDTAVTDEIRKEENETQLDVSRLNETWLD